MLYTTKCYVCKKEGQRGVFSERLQPDDWILLVWNSEHSHHIEAVCSVKCLKKVKIEEEDLPYKRGA